MLKSSLIGLAGAVFAGSMAGCTVTVAIPQDVIDVCDPATTTGCPVFQPGADTAYTISYASGGTWQVSFSCDMTTTSCDYTGRVIAQPGYKIMAATGYDYSYDAASMQYVQTSYPQLITSYNGTDEVDFAQTLSFNPSAADFKLLNFQTEPGAYVEFDMGINGDYSGLNIRYRDPSNTDVSPVGNPVVLYPVSP